MSQYNAILVITITIVATIIMVFGNHLQERTTIELQNFNQNRMK